MSINLEDNIDKQPIVLIVTGPCLYPQVMMQT